MPAPASNPHQPDHAAIEAVLHTYFQGHATAQAAVMQQAFMPSAHVEGNRAEGFVSWPAQQYCALFKGVPAADEATRWRRIDWIDIVGDAAAAKATLSHGTAIFTDLFVLLKLGGQWKIANKVYHAQGHAQPQSLHSAERP
jgi:hypothetical protein